MSDEQIKWLLPGVILVSGDVLMTMVRSGLTVDLDESEIRPDRMYRVVDSAATDVGDATMSVAERFRLLG